MFYYMACIKCCIITRHCQLHSLSSWYNAQNSLHHQHIITVLIPTKSFIAIKMAGTSTPQKCLDHCRCTKYMINPPIYLLSNISDFYTGKKYLRDPIICFWLRGIKQYLLHSKFDNVITGHFLQQNWEYNVSFAIVDTPNITVQLPIYKIINTNTTAASSANSAS